MVNLNYIWLIEVCVVYYGVEVDVVKDYLLVGLKVVYVFENCGLIFFDNEGVVD